MSYILDALKRADAERQRGTVPSLHTRQVTAPALPAASGAQNKRWLAAGAVLILGAIAAGVWYWQAPSGDAHPTDAQIALSSPAPVVRQPQPQPVLTPIPIPVPVTPPQAAAEPAPKPSMPQRRAVVPKPAPPTPAVAVQATPKAKPEAVVAKAAIPSASAPAVPTPTPKPVPVTQASASRAASADEPLLSELPENIRSQIPPMTINGVVYSKNPGQRVLLVNQQVLTQGSQVVPEVSLEEIRPRSSVFSFRGTRFRVAH